MTVYFTKTNDLILFHFNVKKLSMFHFLHIKMMKISFETNRHHCLVLMMMMMMMMMMMNCFCGMVDRRKAISLISSRDHCQRSSPSSISYKPRAGFETAQNLSSGFVEWSCAVVITITPQRQWGICILSNNEKFVYLRMFLRKYSFEYK